MPIWSDTGLPVRWLGYSASTRNAPTLQAAGGRQGETGEGNLATVTDVALMGCGGKRLAVAHEFAEFIEPVYFVAYLGNARIGARLHQVRHLPKDFSILITPKGNKVDENQRKMRSVLIYGSEGDILLDQLSSIPGWELKPLGIEDGHEHCLSKGDGKIALRIIAPNVISTSSVLPYDWERNQDKANTLLNELSGALTGAGIENVVSASDEDLD